MFELSSCVPTKSPVPQHNASKSVELELAVTESIRNGCYLHIQSLIEIDWVPMDLLDLNAKFPAPFQL